MPLTMPAASDLSVYNPPETVEENSQAAGILNGDVTPETAVAEPEVQLQEVQESKDDAGSQEENPAESPASESERPIAAPAASPSGCSPNDFFIAICNLRDKKMQGATALFEANRDVEELKEELKEAKAHVETLTAGLLRMDGELFSLVAEQEKIYGAGSLFAAKPAAAPLTLTETGEQPECSQEENSPPSADESWRTHPLSDLDLSDAITKRLAEEGFRTVGDLSDLTAGGRLLTSIKGIGEGKAAAIEKALEGYWAMRNEKAETAETAAADVATA